MTSAEAARKSWVEEEEFARYLKVISPTQGDPTFSLLKAHLMLEETLNEFIAVKVKSPQHLEDARLSFAQKLMIARAVSSIPDEWVWEALRKLNQLRNKLAHVPEVKDLESRIDELVKFILDSFPVSSSLKSFNEDRSPPTMALVLLYTVLRADLRWERRIVSEGLTLTKGLNSLPKL